MVQMHLTERMTAIRTIPALIGWRHLCGPLVAHQAGTCHRHHRLHMQLLAVVGGLLVYVVVVLPSLVLMSMMEATRHHLWVVTEAEACQGLLLQVGAEPLTCQDLAHAPGLSLVRGGIIGTPHWVDQEALAGPAPLASGVTENAPAATAAVAPTAAAEATAEVDVSGGVVEAGTGVTVVRQ